MDFIKIKEIETRNGNMRIATIFGFERLLAEDHTEQSGPYMNGVWKTAFKALPRHFQPQTIIFFGVGMGGALAIAAKKFPHAKITGIEWDPTLLALAQKKLEHYPNITLVEADAELWVKEMPSTTLSCVDLFTGSDPAPCVQNIAFLKKIIAHSQITFINVFNHLDILHRIDQDIEPFPRKYLSYYVSTIGMYGSPLLRS